MFFHSIDFFGLLLKDVVILVQLCLFNRKIHNATPSERKAFRNSSTKTYESIICILNCQCGKRPSGVKPCIKIPLTISKNLESKANFETIVLIYFINGDSYDK